MKLDDLQAIIDQRNGKALIDHPVTQQTVGIYARLRPNEIPSDSDAAPVIVQAWYGAPANENGEIHVEFYPPESWIGSLHHI